MIHPKFAMLGIRAAVAAFLAAMLAVMTGTYGKKTMKKSRYMPHQGKQEMARRRRAMQGI